jgi:phosphodiesterase/alkaline phosphatase D-like protein
MKKPLLVVTLAIGTLLYTRPITAQEIAPPAKKAARVQITEGPELESTHDTQAIVRWTSNNPGGSDEHYAVLHYGTDPKNLNLTAKSHIRLNQQHSYTVFRVRALNLQPHTTYYYAVDSEDGSGTSDGVNSPVKSFTTQ